MKSFRKAISELKFSIVKVILFETVINSALIFLTALILLSFFGITFIYALSVALAYLAIFLFRRLKLNKISLVERKYSNLDEKLRTATEYSREKNPIVKELHGEIVKSMKKVEETSFVNERKIYLKCIGIIGLCFAAIFLSPVHFAIPDFNLGFNGEGEDLTDNGFGNLKIRFSGNTRDSSLKQISSDLYGAPTVALVGEDEIKVKIRSSGMELNVKTDTGGRASVLLGIFP